MFYMSHPSDDVCMQIEALGVMAHMRLFNKPSLDAVPIAVLGDTGSGVQGVCRRILHKLVSTHPGLTVTHQCRMGVSYLIICRNVNHVSVCPCWI